MNSWLQDNDIEMYLTHNEGKPIVAERFIWTLKNRIYKYMTLVLKNVYIDKLHDVVNQFSSTYHSTIKMKPVDGTSSKYIEFKKSEKDPKFRVRYHVKIHFCKRLLSKLVCRSFC